jgi:hypothetical protein
LQPPRIGGCPFPRAAFSGLPYGYVAGYARRRRTKARGLATHGSDAQKSGALQKAISAFIEKFKPEATYFGLESGQRTAFFVFDMEGSHQCPEVAEAFFGTGGDVHLSPCMTPDDLQSGLGWSPD